MIIHGIGWLEGPFGYNVHARGFFSALARLMPTVVSSLFMLDGPHEADRKTLRRLYQDRPIASIALMYGHLAGQVLRGAPGSKIIYTVWESTRLPDEWLEPLKGADQVWTPSRWGAAVMARNGIDARRLHVIPEGIDPGIFNPNAPATDVLASHGGYKFLHVGRYEDRKGTKTLIRAFDDEFSSHDDALLVLACHNPHQDRFDIAKELQALKIRNPDKLIFIPPVARHDVLAGLYTACDAFVAPSRAEGWGLPIIEAMACDLPVITTGHSAPLDFLGPEAFRISSKMAAITTPFFESSDGDHGMWAEPDFAHLRHLMRELYDNPRAAKANGRIGGKRIRANFTWDHAAERALLALNTLDGTRQLL